MRAIDLVHPGDLVFDVGAHAGLQTRAFLERGARVVAIEPLWYRVQQLRNENYEAMVEDRLRLEECALGHAKGQAALRCCQVRDAISSLSVRWTRISRFAAEWTWDSEYIVEVETLDRMMAKHGRPDFVHLDVCGMESYVLDGMSFPPPALAFPFFGEFMNAASTCLLRLQHLGMREFNMSRSDDDALLFETWTDALTIRQHIPIEHDGVIYGRISS
jgi:FkbM family methyltransferase